MIPDWLAISSLIFNYLVAASIMAKYAHNRKWDASYGSEGNAVWAGLFWPIILLLVLPFEWWQKD